MDNYLIKTLAYNKQVRILFVENTDLIGEICSQPNMHKLLKTTLGTTVSVASLLSGTLKGNQRISLKVNTSKHSYKIFADSDSMGNVRGYLSDQLLHAPVEELDSLSLRQLIGAKGYLQVTKDIGMNSNFTGITEMPYSNIVDDISHYFKQSEQTSSWLSITILFNERNEVVLSRGVMAQLLPGAPNHLIQQIKNKITDQPLHLSATENSASFKAILNSMFEDIEIVGMETLQLFCGCSKEILYSMLYSLGTEELTSAYENNSPIEIVCNVCGKKYMYKPDEIAGLL